MFDHQRQLADAIRLGLGLSCVGIALAGPVEPDPLAADFRLLGVMASDGVGFAVSGAGDVNGDGVADVVIGAPGANTDAGFRSGASYVLFGPVGMGDLLTSEIGDGGFVINGPGQEKSSGFSVSGAGDVNGDGLDDLIVGAVASLTNNDVGESQVVFGKPDNDPVDLAELGAGGFRIEGIRLGGNLGLQVSGAGDVNGDGLDDLVVGDPTDDDGDGAAYVIFGKADADTVSLGRLGDRGFKILSAEAASLLGTSVSGAGDVDGDGLADVIVGARGTEAGRGAAWVIFGRAAAADVELSAPGDRAIRLSAGGSFRDLGSTVSGAGDVNGDGLADVLVVGTEGDEFRGFTIRPTVAFVLFGSEAPGDTELGPTEFDGYRLSGGESVDNLFFSAGGAGAGDVNGDGLFDLLVGAVIPGGGTTASAFLSFGKADTGEVDLDTIAAGTGQVLPGQQDGFSFGTSLRAAGDVDRNGLADVVIGDFFAVAEGPKGGLQPGAATVATAVGTPPAGATYRATSPAGAQSRAWPVGVIGNGSDASSPAARAWLGFDGGAAGSLQTVTLHRTAPALRDLPTGNAVAGVSWTMATDRTGWTEAEVTVRYLDAEVAGLNESALELWQWSPADEAYLRLETTRDPDRNTASATVTFLSDFILAQPDAIFDDGFEEP